MLARIQPYFLWCLLIIVCILAISGTNIANAHFIKLMTDAALEQHWHHTLHTAVLILPVMMIGFLAQFGFKQSTAVFSGGINKNLTQHLMERILRFPLSKLERTHSGDILSRLINDLQLIQQFFKHTFHNLVSQPIIFCLTFMYLLTINWQLAVLCVMLMPIVTLAVSKVSARITSYSKSVQTYESQANTVANEMITSMPVIKAYDLQTIFYEKYKYEVDRVIGHKKRIAKTNFIMQSVTTFLVMSPYLVVALFGGYFALEAHLSVGDLIAFIVLMQYLSGPISDMPHLFSQARICMAGFSRVYELFTVKLENQTIGLFIQSPLSPGHPVIRFSHVTFSYDGQKNALDNVSLDINNYERIGIVGVSGSGKSTLVDLLCAFYSQQQGRIDVFGQRLDEWNPDALRQQFAIVSQNVHLFPTTIESNIRCGNPNARCEEIKQAATIADAHSFIMRLPERYQTKVGEHGMTLSGGQRQRIAIARALIKEAPILVLDEAMSALDTQTEMRIHNALSKLKPNRTTIMITHRLSTVKRCDRIIVLHNGRMVESGKHDELLNERGVYRHLFMSQTSQAEGDIR